MAMVLSYLPLNVAKTANNGIANFHAWQTGN